MNPESDEQTAILRNIWQEIKALGESLGGRIDQTNEGLAAVRTDLGARIEQTNVRLDLVRTELSTEISAMRTELGARLERVEETLRDLAAQQLMLTR
jgi:hypothetical protein